MKHTPGSFSKNFGWREKGLRKLHNAIQRGFSGTLTSVGRTTFRKNSGLDNSLSLIPVNFFLHNLDSEISVDELVFQSIEFPHSSHFDWLGLFALHLNRAGSGSGVKPRPAMWANEFVREYLWRDESWDSSTLSDVSLDTILKNKMEAQQDVRVKCRNNYRHLFELCGFRSGNRPIINTQAEQWIVSALFLAWDRYILDGGSKKKSNLLKLVCADELYKLIGVTQEHALEQADSLADLYASVGRLERFRAGEKSPSLSVSPQPEFELKVSDLVKQEGVDCVVQRRMRWQQCQSRAKRKAVELKRYYDNTCQFCGMRLQVGNGQFYSEAAHVRGLGQPHDGPDKVSNMLVLCPNHHLQFDRGVLRLQQNDVGYSLLSEVPGDPLQGKAITLKHELDEVCVEYHFKWFQVKNA